MTFFPLLTRAQVLRILGIAPEVLGLTQSQLDVIRTQAGAGPVTSTTSNATVTTGTLPAFTAYNLGAATVSGGGVSSMLLSAPAETGTVALHGQVIALPTTAGSQTFLIRTTYPELGYFSASVFLASSSSPHLGVLYAAYPNAAGTYTALLDWPDNSGANTLKLADNPGAFAKAGQQHFIRVSFDGAMYTFAGSQSGQQGGWTVIGTATKAALHNPDRIGIYVFPNDGTGNGSPTKIELLGYAASTSADVQQEHGVVPVASSVPPAPIKYIQQKHKPSAAPITRSVQGIGVQVADPTKNVTYLKFSSTDANATVRDRATMDAQCFYTNMFGDLNAPNYSPQNGIPSNFYSVYANYPAGDERDLMPILADGVHLKARSRLATSSDSYPVECAQLRMQTEYLPGDTVQIRAKLPSSDRAPGSYWSWPTFWSFTGWEDWVTEVRYLGDNNSCIEFDMPDSYQRMGLRQGTTITQGVILYGDPAAYNNPSTVFRADGPDYLPSANPSNSLAVFGNPDTDPTEGFHTYTHHISPANDKVYFWIDDKLTWIVSVKCPAINRQVGTDGTTQCIIGTPVDSARLGKPLGNFIQISHQFGVRFNGDDIVKLESALAAGPVIADDYIIDYFAHWRSAPVASALVPQAPTPSANPTLNGEAYAWRGKADAAAYDGAGLPLVIQGPSSPGAITHSLTKPMGATTGTWTVCVAGIYPSSDYFRGSALLLNGTTGKHLMYFALYPNGEGTYGYLATQDDETGTNQVAKTSAQRHAFARINRRYYIRFVIDGTTVQVLGSATGGMNTWTVIGAMTLADAGNPDRIGAYCAPVDTQQVGVPGQARLYSVAYNASLIAQAAI